MPIREVKETWERPSHTVMSCNVKVVVTQGRCTIVLICVDQSIKHWWCQRPANEVIKNKSQSEEDKDTRV